MPEFKGYETSKYSVPTHVEGANYAKVSDVNMSARGDMPKAGSEVPGTQGYRGPAKAEFVNKGTEHISKLGPSS